MSGKPAHYDDHGGPSHESVSEPGPRFSKYDEYSDYKYYPDSNELLEEEEYVEETKNNLHIGKTVKLTEYNSSSLYVYEDHEYHRHRKLSTNQKKMKMHERWWSGADDLDTSYETPDDPFYCDYEVDLVSQHGLVSPSKISHAQKVRQYLKNFNNSHHGTNQTFSDSEYYCREYFIVRNGISFRFFRSSDLPVLHHPPVLGCGYFPKKMIGRRRYVYLAERYIESLSECLKYSRRLTPPPGMRVGNMKATDLMEFHNLGVHIHGFFTVWENENLSDNLRKRYLVDVYNYMMFPLFIPYYQWENRLKYAFDIVTTYNLHLTEILRRNSSLVTRLIASERTDFTFFECNRFLESRNKDPVQYIRDVGPAEFYLICTRGIIEKYLNDLSLIIGGVKPFVTNTGKFFEEIHAFDDPKTAKCVFHTSKFSPRADDYLSDADLDCYVQIGRSQENSDYGCRDSNIKICNPHNPDEFYRLAVCSMNPSRITPPMHITYGDDMVVAAEVTVTTCPEMKPSDSGPIYEELFSEQKENIVGNDNFNEYHMIKVNDKRSHMERSTSLLEISEILYESSIKNPSVLKRTTSSNSIFVTSEYYKDVDTFFEELGVFEQTDNEKYRGNKIKLLCNITLNEKISPLCVGIHKNVEKVVRKDMVVLNKNLSNEIYKLYCDAKHSCFANINDVADAADTIFRMVANISMSENKMLQHLSHFKLQDNNFSTAQEDLKPKATRSQIIEALAIRLRKNLLDISYLSKIYEASIEKDQHEEREENSNSKSLLQPSFEGCELPIDILEPEKEQLDEKCVDEGDHTTSDNTSSEDSNKELLGQCDDMNVNADKEGAWNIDELENSTIIESEDMGKSEDSIRDLQRATSKLSLLEVDDCWQASLHPTGVDTVADIVDTADLYQPSTVPSEYSQKEVDSALDLKLTKDNQTNDEDSLKLDGDSTKDKTEDLNTEQDAFRIVNVGCSDTVGNNFNKPTHRISFHDLCSQKETFPEFFAELLQSEMAIEILQSEMDIIINVLRVGEYDFTNVQQFLQDFDLLKLNTAKSEEIFRNVSKCILYDPCDKKWIFDFNFDVLLDVSCDATKQLLLQLFKNYTKDGEEQKAHSTTEGEPSSNSIENARKRINEIIESSESTVIEKRLIKRYRHSLLDSNLEDEYNEDEDEDAEEMVNTSASMVDTPKEKDNNMKADLEKEDLHYDEISLTENLFKCSKEASANVIFNIAESQHANFNITHMPYSIDLSSETCIANKARSSEDLSDKLNNVEVVVDFEIANHETVCANLQSSEIVFASDNINNQEEAECKLDIPREMKDSVHYWSSLVKEDTNASSSITVPLRNVETCSVHIWPPLELDIVNVQDKKAEVTISIPRKEFITESMWSQNVEFDMVNMQAEKTEVTFSIPRRERIEESMCSKNVQFDMVNIQEQKAEVTLPIPRKEFITESMWMKNVEFEMQESHHCAEMTFPEKVHYAESLTLCSRDLRDKRSRDESVETVLYRNDKLAVSASFKFVEESAVHEIQLTKKEEMASGQLSLICGEFEESSFHVSLSSKLDLENDSNTKIHNDIIFDIGCTESVTQSVVCGVSDLRKRRAKAKDEYEFILAETEEASLYVNTSMKFDRKRKRAKGEIASTVATMETEFVEATFEEVPEVSNDNRSCFEPNMVETDCQCEFVSLGEIEKETISVKENNREKVFFVATVGNQISVEHTDDISNANTATASQIDVAMNSTSESIEYYNDTLEDAQLDLLINEARDIHESSKLMNVKDEAVLAIEKQKDDSTEFDNGAFQPLSSEDVCQPTDSSILFDESSNNPFFIEEQQSFHAISSNAIPSRSDIPSNSASDETPSMFKPDGENATSSKSTDSLSEYFMAQCDTLTEMNGEQQYEQQKQFHEETLNSFNNQTVSSFINEESDFNILHGNMFPDQQPIPLNDAKADPFINRQSGVYVPQGETAAQRHAIVEHSSFIIDLSEFSLEMPYGNQFGYHVCGHLRQIFSTLPKEEPKKVNNAKAMVYEREKREVLIRPDAGRINSNFFAELRNGQPPRNNRHRVQTMLMHLYYSMKKRISGNGNKLNTAEQSEFSIEKYFEFVRFLEKESYFPLPIEPSDCSFIPISPYFYTQCEQLHVNLQCQEDTMIHGIDRYNPLNLIAEKNYSVIDTYRFNRQNWFVTLKGGAKKYPMEYFFQKIIVGDLECQEGKLNMSDENDYVISLNVSYPAWFNRMIMHDRNRNLNRCQQCDRMPVVIINDCDCESQVMMKQKPDSPIVCCVTMNIDRMESAVYDGKFVCSHGASSTLVVKKKKGPGARGGGKGKWKECYNNWAYTVLFERQTLIPTMIEWQFKTALSVSLPKSIREFRKATSLKLSLQNMEFERILMRNSGREMEISEEEFDRESGNAGSSSMSRRIPSMDQINISPELRANDAVRLPSRNRYNPMGMSSMYPPPQAHDNRLALPGAMPNQLGMQVHGQPGFHQQNFLGQLNHSQAQAQQMIYQQNPPTAQSYNQNNGQLIHGQIHQQSQMPSYSQQYGLREPPFGNNNMERYPSFRQANVSNQMLPHYPAVQNQNPQTNTEIDGERMRLMHEQQMVSQSQYGNEQQHVQQQNHERLNIRGEEIIPQTSVQNQRSGAIPISDNMQMQYNNYPYHGHVQRMESYPNDNLNMYGASQMRMEDMQQRQFYQNQQLHGQMDSNMMNYQQHAGYPQQSMMSGHHQTPGLIPEMFNEKDKISVSLPSNMTESQKMVIQQRQQNMQYQQQNQHQLQHQHRPQQQSQQQQQQQQRLVPHQSQQAQPLQQHQGQLLSRQLQQSCISNDFQLDASRSQSVINNESYHNSTPCTPNVNYNRPASSLTLPNRSSQPLISPLQPATSQSQQGETNEEENNIEEEEIDDLADVQPYNPSEYEAAHNGQDDLMGIVPQIQQPQSVNDQYSYNRNQLNQGNDGNNQLNFGNMDETSPGGMFPGQYNQPMTHTSGPEVNGEDIEDSTRSDKQSDLDTGKIPFSSLLNGKDKNIDDETGGEGGGDDDNDDDDDESPQGGSGAIANMSEPIMNKVDNSLPTANSISPSYYSSTASSHRSIVPELSSLSGKPSRGFERFETIAAGDDLLTMVQVIPEVEIETTFNEADNVEVEVVAEEPFTDNSKRTCQLRKFKIFSKRIQKRLDKKSFVIQNKIRSKSKDRLLKFKYGINNELNRTNSETNLDEIERYATTKSETVKAMIYNQDQLENKNGETIRSEDCEKELLDGYTFFAHKNDDIKRNYEKIVTMLGQNEIHAEGFQQTSNFDESLHSQILDAAKNACLHNYRGSDSFDGIPKFDSTGELVNGDVVSKSMKAYFQLQELKKRLLEKYDEIIETEMIPKHKRNTKLHIYIDAFHLSLNFKLALAERTMNFIISKVFNPVFIYCVDYMNSDEMMVSLIARLKVEFEMLMKNLIDLEPLRRNVNDFLHLPKYVSTGRVENSVRAFARGLIESLRVPTFMMERIGHMEWINAVPEYEHAIDFLNLKIEDLTPSEFDFDGFLEKIRLLNFSPEIVGQMTTSFDSPLLSPITLLLGGLFRQSAALYQVVSRAVPDGELDRRMMLFYENQFFQRTVRILLRRGYCLSRSDIESSPSVSNSIFISSIASIPQVEYDLLFCADQINELYKALMNMRIDDPMMQPVRNGYDIRIFESSIHLSVTLEHEVLIVTDSRLNSRRPSFVDQFTNKDFYMAVVGSSKIKLKVERETNLISAQFMFDEENPRSDSFLISQVLPGFIQENGEIDWEYVVKQCLINKLDIKRITERSFERYLKETTDRMDRFVREPLPRGILERTDIPEVRLDRFDYYQMYHGLKRTRNLVAQAEILNKAYNEQDLYCHPSTSADWPHNVQSTPNWFGRNMLEHFGETLNQAEYNLEVEDDLLEGGYTLFNNESDDDAETLVGGYRGLQTNEMIDIQNDEKKNGNSRKRGSDEPSSSSGPAKRKHDDE